VAALAEGARRAGLAGAERALARAEVEFVDYSGMFAAAGTQGVLPVEDVETVRVLVAELLAELEADDPVGGRVLADARAQLSSAERQGVGEVFRVLVNVVTTVLQLPGLRQAGQWVSARSFLSHLAQVAAYLDRTSPLGAKIRALVADAVGESAVVVAHSLGSVVAFEAVHELGGTVPLLVTLGSPLAMSTVVWQRLVPQPPRTPENLGRWLNFWDRDDVVVARPRLADRVLANAAGVVPVTTRIRSTGLWAHTATKYLTRPEVAAPVIEAL
jgi:hypothetical protein